MSNKDRTIYSLRALGKDDLPARFVLGGVEYIVGSPGTELEFAL